jgi:hypothetical protein
MKASQQVVHYAVILAKLVGDSHTISDVIDTPKGRFSVSISFLKLMAISSAVGR